MPNSHRRTRRRFRRVGDIDRTLLLWTCSGLNFPSVTVVELRYFIVGQTTSDPKTMMFIKFTLSYVYHFLINPIREQACFCLITTQMRLNCNADIMRSKDSLRKRSSSKVEHRVVVAWTIFLKSPEMLDFTAWTLAQRIFSSHYICLYDIISLLIVVWAASLIGRNAVTWRWSLSNDQRVTWPCIIIMILCIL